MKTKLELAHDWAMRNYGQFNTEKDLAKFAWKYADAMYEELEKRESKERPAIIAGVVAPAEHYYNGKKFDSLKDACEYAMEQWQPDWSQAPDGFNWFAVDKNGLGYFYSYKPKYDDEHDYWYDVDCLEGSALLSELHGYTGDWKDSLRERP